MRSLIITTMIISIIFNSHCAVAKGQIVNWTKSENLVIANIDWCLNHSPSNTECPSNIRKKNPETPRVTESDTVQVAISGFNFVNYELEVSIAETKIESYVYLNSLWNQLLGGVSLDLIADFVATRSRDRDGEEAPEPLLEWWKKLDETSVDLANLGRAYSGQSYLSESDLQFLVDSLPDIYGQDGKSGWVGELNSLRLTARESLKRSRMIKNFEAIDNLHQQLIAQLNSYALLVNKSSKGYVTSIKKKDAGTLVDVVLNATSLPNGSKAETTSFSYLSESKFPLTFHAGFTVSQLKDSEFQALRSANGQDIFAQIKDEDTTQSLAVFLSHPFGRKVGGKHNYYATLGTDIDDLGENIYVGLTRRVSENWLFSVGAAYGKQTVGEQPAEGSPSTNIFEIIKEEREAELFLSVSYQLF